MLVRGERYFALTLTPTIFPRSDEAVPIAVKLRMNLKGQTPNSSTLSSRLSGRIISHDYAFEL